MKRFWQQVTVAPDAAGLCAVLLDGQSLKTPAGKDCLCPTLALAEAVAVEWRGVKDKIDPVAMPMTQLTVTALDLISVQRVAVIDQIMAYADTDLLCYRTTDPPELAARQAAMWQPYLDWSARQCDAVLKVTTGVRHIEQDAAARKALHQAVAAYDDFRLTALQNAVNITGSLILGVAFVMRWRDAAAIFEAAELDATYQIERWGADAEAVVRQEMVKADLVILDKFISCLALPL
ncbi:MAG: ATP12 family protein [Alphaproteobacteria bacterium]